MVFDVLGAHVVFGEALVSTVCNAYLRTTELSFLCDFVNDGLDLSLWCDGEKKHVSGPTLYEHLLSLNVAVVGAGSGERYVFFSTHVCSIWAWALSCFAAPLFTEPASNQSVGWPWLCDGA